jgi:hypothetical protein
MEATRRFGFTSTTTAPDGLDPPRRHPESQQPAALRDAPDREGAATLAQRPCPPADVSMAVVSVDVAGFAPAATHQSPGSHAATDRLTVGLMAGVPVPSAGGVTVPDVVPHPTSSTPAHTAASAMRAFTGVDGRRGSALCRSTLRAVSWVDAVIIVWVVLAAIRGRALGALTQLLGLVGFVAGLAIGAVVAVPVAGRLDAGAPRTVITTAIVLGAALLAAIGGNVLGKWANVAMRRLHLGAVDAVAGAVVAALGALFSAWLVAGLFTQSSVSWLARPIQTSAVLTAIDAVMPPVPSVISRAEAFLSSDVFPIAFAAVTQPTTTSVAVPSQKFADSMARPVEASVLKVTASGACGVTREGTSFVVAPDLLITNAHVVAGETSIDVATRAGELPARLVVFDPSLDVALLRVPHLALRPIVLQGAHVATGNAAAIVGFPGGGPRDAQPAGVAAILSAQGRDIYGGSLVTRSIYAVTASVRPGNSGSPLIVGGQAVGMVFSRSLAQGDLAYALLASTLEHDVSIGAGTSVATSSGACTPG